MHTSILSKGLQGEEWQTESEWIYFKYNKLFSLVHDVAGLQTKV